jgi:hypothetical protein
MTTFNFLLQCAAYLYAMICMVRMAISNWLPSYPTLAFTAFTALAVVSAVAMR